MAHRDIKVNLQLKKKDGNNIQSSNILVSDCGKNVVLADFGLSMRLSSDMYSSSQSIGQAGNLFFLFLQEIHYVSWTSRYMSPELLDRYSDLSNPESFKQVDLYALSLVIWEILNRTTLSEMDKAPGKAVY